MKKANVKKEIKETGCQDRLCPSHGEIRVRGRSFVGEVVSSKMHKTATVQWERLHFLPKFERYEKRKTRVKAHNPVCIDAKEGDIVKISETRPISKTKGFVIVEKRGSLKGFKERQEALEASKVKEKSKEEGRENEATKS